MSQHDGDRRRLRGRAVLGAPLAAETGPAASTRTGPPAREEARVRPGTATEHGGAVPGPHAVCGAIVDASPHLLILDTGDAEPVRLPLAPSTSIWYGGRSGLHVLVPGREAIVRPSADGPGADRVWVDIMRVTGTILSYDGRLVEVDGGPHRGRTHVSISTGALGRVLVRHPHLEPGYLMDVICVRSPDGPRAVRPGTSQPGHRANRLTPPAAGTPPSTTVRGTATWFGDLRSPAPHPGPHPGAPGRGTSGSGWQGSSSHDAAPPGRSASGSQRQDPAPHSARPSGPDGLMAGIGGALRGAAYPAVDPEGDAGGCVDAPQGCAPLPYLSYGSELIVRNECNGRAARVPVIECGCVAARYCDRCVECGTSPRGRIVELTPACFADLGGDLDAGCFNVTLDLAATAVVRSPAVEGPP
ncbi:hypothetical protein SAMN04489712_111236 [Thermomonospora echinospora]|uniref:Uncharacterized protein n=1 Tax=Thermomonospora echinospora TaxID=1992 RepID=A0A1H6CX53_9ACTN|nr:hypothetical protein [Thermomonospora echinospora]SEG77006.1 hypothetical protein SAMN04489712_111236 [Thermomonospora echinospora]